MSLPRDPAALTERYGLTAEQARAVAVRGRLVVVSAGAGTGKTTTMASRYVDTALALAERALFERPERPPRPRRILERIAAVTFTELAAGELRGRIAGVFERVAPRLAPWPALRRFACEAARLEGDLPIGTIHGLCGRVLRRMAFTGAVTPDFEVMDELDRGLLWHAVLDQSFDRLAAEEPELVARLLSGREQASSIRATLWSLVCRLEEEDLAALAERTRAEVAAEAGELAVRLLHDTAAEPAIRDAVEEAAARAETLEVTGKGFRKALEPALRWVRGQGSASLAAEKIPGFGATERRLAKLDPGDAAVLERFAAAIDPLKKLSKTLAEALDDDVLDREHAWTRDVAQAARHAAAAFREAKETRGAVDFDDLERLGLRALRSGGEVGHAAPFDEILVDEFQDTSDRQVAILEALSGPDLARVFAVGDAKQSIYRFRGADVAVFNRVADQVPGGAAPLTINRRSTPGVMGFVNALFERLFPERPPADAPWVAPMQRLEALREELEGAPLPPLVLVPWWAGPEEEGGDAPKAEERRSRDASVTAAAVERITRILGAADGHGAEVGVLLRAVRGVRRVYADAIVARGVKVAVEAGGTFTRDGAAATGIALVRALALPGHRAAWTAVLRGPLVGLGDGAVARMSHRGTGPWPDRVAELLAAEPLLVGDAAPVLAALAAGARDPGPLAERARRVLDAAGVASRQLDKVLDLTADLEGRGLGPLETVAWFEALVADDKEKRVPDPPGRGSVVRALTVHASKGLEFPVVVASQLADPLVRTSGPDDVVEEEGRPRVGLAVPGDSAGVARTWNAHLDRKRDLAEQLRLLYVALTRARNHLVLPLPLGLKDDGDGTAGGEMLPLLKGLDLEREGLQTLRLPGGVEIPVAVWPTAPDAIGASDDVDASAGRAPVLRAPRPAGPATWSVTRLASLAFCPAYHAQAPVAPWPRPVRRREYPDPPPTAGEEPVSSADRGTLIHRWFEQVRARGGEADVSLPEPLAEEGAGLRERLEAMVAHPELAEAFAPDARVHTELPLEASRGGVVLTGSIDRLSLTRGPDGAVRATVTDFKTGRTGFPGPGGRNPGYLEAYRFQLSTYAWMLGDLLGEALHPAVACRLAFVDLGEVVPLDVDVREAAARVDGVLAELRAPGTLPPNHAACPGCRMQRFCPVARDGAGP